MPVDRIVTLVKGYPLSFISLTFSFIDISQNLLAIMQNDMHLCVLHSVMLGLPVMYYKLVIFLYLLVLF